LAGGRRRTRRVSDGDLAYAVHLATLLVVASLSLLFTAEVIAGNVVWIGFLAVGLSDVVVDVAARRLRRSLG
jgi:hypothetical protein